MGGFLSQYHSLSSKEAQFLIFDILLFPHLFDKVVEKLLIQDYVNLQRSCKTLKEAITQSRAIPIMRIARIDVNKYEVKAELILNNRSHGNYKQWNELFIIKTRIFANQLVIEGNLSDGINNDQLIYLTKELEKYKVVVERTHIDGKIALDFLELEKLCKITHSQLISTNERIPFSWLNHNLFKNSPGFIGASILVDYGLPQEDMHDTSLATISEITRIIKEWHRGERKLKHIRIDTSLLACADSEIISKILENIPANPIWTPDLHSSSLLNKLHLGEPMLRNIWPAYSLWRADDIKRILTITFLEKGVLFEEINLDAENYEGKNLLWMTGEMGNFFDFLPKWVYLEITGRCRECGVKSCYHSSQFRSILKYLHQDHRLPFTIAFYASTAIFLILLFLMISFSFSLGLSIAFGSYSILYVCLSWFLLQVCLKIRIVFEKTRTFEDRDDFFSDALVDIYFL